MAQFACIGLAVVCAFAISVCGANPTPDSRTTNVKTATDEDSLNIPYWLRSAVMSAKQLTLNNNSTDEEEAALDLVNKQNNTFKMLEDALPIFIHKENVDSGVTPSSLSDTDKVNPFVRSKRSTCTRPGNLPQLVKDLNQHLTASQFLGLYPAEPTTTPAPTSENLACPRGPTGDWWPKSEMNLRSTCPWTLVPKDLGETAFPRYVNTAKCMCDKSCVGSDETMKCKEVTYDVTVLNQTGCQYGLAVMERLTVPVSIGCHCVGAMTQSSIGNQNKD
ncbi:hypothetical protein BsWGS_21309 [Bradybaena similaris]